MIWVPGVAIRRRLSRKRSGLTLIEAVMVGAILAMLIAVVARLLYSSWKSEEVLTRQVDLREATEKALDQVVDKMRGGDEVLDAQANAIRFNLPETGTSTVVTYFLDGEILYTETDPETPYSPGTAQAVVEEVSAFDLSYYDSDGAELSPIPLDDPGAVFAVKIHLRVERSGQHADLHSQVRLRNRM